MLLDRLDETNSIFMIKLALTQIRSVKRIAFVDLEIIF